MVLKLFHFKNCISLSFMFALFSLLQVAYPISRFDVRIYFRFNMCIYVFISVSNLFVTCGQSPSNKVLLSTVSDKFLSLQRLIHSIQYHNLIYAIINSYVTTPHQLFTYFHQFSIFAVNSHVDVLQMLFDLLKMLLLLVFTFRNHYCVISITYDFIYYKVLYRILITYLIPSAVNNLYSSWLSEFFFTLFLYWSGKSITESYLYSILCSSIVDDLHYNVLNS